MDLALGEPTTVVPTMVVKWLGDKPCTPARDVQAVAAGRPGGRLVRGTVLRLEVIVPCYHWEGIATLVWSARDAGLGVPFLHSGMVARWSHAALLANHLIVPVDHPIVGDDDRADLLVRDLQDVTRAFREANGLPPDGWPAPASAVPRNPRLRACE